MERILKTYEISVEILNIINNTKEYCYIVSPYIKIWPQLDRVLNEASKNKVFLTFVIREDIKSKQLVDLLNKKYGFEVYVIKDLHIKLFLNEQKCLFSTMNLYDASQQNNLELGYFISNPLNIKNEIIEKYILGDKSAIQYKGSFEDDRKQKLESVEVNRENAKQYGYCVDCGKKIDLDYNYNTRIIRCIECYIVSTNNQNTDINFCHYCGKKMKGLEFNPFHPDCSTKVGMIRKELRNY